MERHSKRKTSKREKAYAPQEQVPSVPIIRPFQLCLQILPFPLKKMNFTSENGRVDIGFLQIGLLSLTSLRKTVTGRDGVITKPALLTRLTAKEIDGIICSRTMNNS